MIIKVWLYYYQPEPRAASRSVHPCRRRSSTKYLHATSDSKLEQPSKDGAADAPRQNLTTVRNSASDSEKPIHAVERRVDRLTAHYRYEKFNHYHNERLA